MKPTFDDGVLAEWSTPGLPRLVARVHSRDTVTVDVSLRPAARPILGITDPAELDVCILVLAAARDRLVEAQRGDQATLFDEVAR